jgi:hypothetical protein
MRKKGQGVLCIYPGHILYARGSSEAPSETPRLHHGRTLDTDNGYTLDTPWIHSGYTVTTRTGWARAGDILDTPWIQAGYTFDTSLRPKHHGLHPGYAKDTHWIHK